MGRPPSGNEQQMTSALDMEPVKISSHPTSKPEAPVKSRKIADSVKAVLDKGADSGNADLPFTS